jgi:hypothetical protein
MELFCLFFMGVLGLEAVSPKPFSEKASPRISATVFTGNAEKCQQLFKRFTKVMRRIVRRMVGRVTPVRAARLNCKQTARYGSASPSISRPPHETFLSAAKDFCSPLMFSTVPRQRTDRTPV